MIRAATPTTGLDYPIGGGRQTSYRLVDDIRQKLTSRFPDVNDQPETGHPMIAVGVVLVSAIILQTTDISRLVTFTGYSPSFVSAVAVNMVHNKLWIVGGSVDSQHSKWFSPDALVSDDREFWDHIEIACGMMWMLGINTTVALDPCKIFWDERLRPN